MIKIFVKLDVVQKVDESEFTVINVSRSFLPIRFVHQLRNK